MNNLEYLKTNIDQNIIIPLSNDWDWGGIEQGYLKFEEQILDEIIPTNDDFEVNRFEHSEYDGSTDINYSFYFYNIEQSIPVTATTITSTTLWNNSYLQKFTPTQIYYFDKPFENSFFKLDLYDTPDSNNQTLYLTIIIPTSQGSVSAYTSTTFSQNIKTPNFTLDYVGDQEGFYIYWLKKRDFLNIDTFYMSAKFFDGRFGQFIRMTNTPQCLIGNNFSFNNTDYFYYKVNLSYSSQTYTISTYPGDVRTGYSGSPIKWYEYVNP